MPDGVETPRETRGGWGWKLTPWPSAGGEREASWWKTCSGQREMVVDEKLLLKTID